MHDGGKNTRARLLGVTVDLIDQEGFLDLLCWATARSENTIIASCNLHAVYLHHRDREFARFFSTADLVYVDGVPLTWWGRLMGLPLDTRHRITFLDYVHDFLRLANQRRWRLFHLGGREGVANEAIRILSKSYPDVAFASHHGYFDWATENERVVDAMRAFKPHIVLLGMGMPLQERWILANAPRFSGVTFIAVGAAFDYVAGVKATPPRWLGPIGLEWAYRLATEPARLAHRYLVEPWFLLPHAVRDIMTYRL